MNLDDHVLNPLLIQYYDQSVGSLRPKANSIDARLHRVRHRAVDPHLFNCHQKQVLPPTLLF